MITQRRINNRQIKSTMIDSNTLPHYQPSNTKRIALIQPGSYGDNINSTLMFKPLKNKWPDSTIDVYTSTTFGSAFHNNPYINFLHESPSDSKQTALHQLVTTPPAIASCGYDIIFNPHPMINSDKWTSIKTGELGTNLICAWVRALENADVEYTLPLETILRLTQQEVDKIDNYCSHVNMNLRKNVMEISGESGQTFWNHIWTEKTIRLLCEKGEMVFVSYRSNTDQITRLRNDYPGLVHFVGELSIREVAELFNRCDRFFSVSSGLSNACNTNWCKTNIEWIETINSEVVSSAPIRKSGKKFWYDNNLDAFLDFVRSSLC